MNTHALLAEDEEELEPRGLAPDEAARLRAQMEDLLRRSDEARAENAGDEEAMTYGREMWARCEALTAGVTGALVMSMKGST